MGLGTGKTKRNAKQFRTPVDGGQAGISVKHRTGVPTPMAHPYPVMEMYHDNCLTELTPKNTKLMPARMDK